MLGLASSSRSADKKSVHDLDLSTITLPCVLMRRPNQYGSGGSGGGRVGRILESQFCLARGFS
jgi:hypothetical protein